MVPPRLRALVAAATTALCFGLAQPQRAAAPDPGLTTATHDGRDYLLYTPRSLPKGRKVPLLVILHGGGGNARDMVNKRLNPIAEKRGFLVAYLNGAPAPAPLDAERRTWNAGGGCCGPAARSNADDVAYIDGFLKEAGRRYPVDAKRVYLAGHSNGAMMAYRFACERPGRVAAVVALAGPLMLDRCRAPGLRVLHVHGREDENVPVKGGRGRRSIAGVDFQSVEHTRRQLEAAGASFRLEIVPGADHALYTIDRALIARGDGLHELIGSFLAGS